MKKMIIMLNLLAVSAYAGPKNGKVIYGDDNRVDVYASSNSAFVELSKSTAAMIKKSKIKKSGDTYTLDSSSTLANRRNACESERFRTQPTVASCSGFLVGPKHIVTAGHCIEDMSDCNASNWVFDYKMKNDTEANLVHTKETVYNCKKIVSTKLGGFKNDYALIELDREVTGRTPLKFRRRGSVRKGDKLVVIGHPSGLPTKIADGATVKGKKLNYFISNLDTYGGNSGSAVFNVSSGQVEGILVRGEQDYVRRGGCTVSNRLGNNDEDTGEQVTYIKRVKGLRKL